MTDKQLTVPALRPTTALRDRIIDRLSSGFAHGAIDTDEFERRVTVVHRSESAVEIEALVNDLPASHSPTPSAPPTRALVPASQAPESGRTLSVFGNTVRRGNWTVPRKLEVRAIFGNVELDFREAVLPTGVVELHLRPIFGNIEITVPPNLAIQAEGNAVFGNFDHVSRAPTQAAPDAPVLRVIGTSVFGNVEIHMRLPGEQPGWRRMLKGITGR
jgi:hypothetical protein